MKTIDLYGIGNGIIDVLVEVSDQEFEALGLKKGSMSLLGAEEQAEFLERFSDRDRKLVSGGSVANSTVLFAQLGGKAAFSCRLADDNYGVFYKSEFEGLGIDIPNPLHMGGQSGTSAIVITPDAERTMRTCLGESGAFGAGEIEDELVRQSKWIFVEGYLFSNPDHGQKAIGYALELAKKYDTKVAITLSDAWVVEEFRSAVEEALQHADLVFANEVEAKALTGAESGSAAFEEFKQRFPQAVVTLSGEGCFVKAGDYSGHIPAFKVTPTDLTGAGDAFAGSLIFGLVSGLGGEQAARSANFMAAEVIQKIGARLHADAKELWAAAEE